MSLEQKLIEQNEVLIKQNRMIISLLTEERKAEMMQLPKPSQEGRDKLLGKQKKRQK